MIFVLLLKVKLKKITIHLYMLYINTSNYIIEKKYVPNCSYIIINII